MKIEFSKSLHFYSNHGAQIFVGRHRLPVAHSDIQVQLRVGHCPSCGIFSSAGLAETLYLGRGQCSCFNGKFLQLSYSIQVLLVTAVAGVIRLIVCSFIFWVFGDHPTCCLLNINTSQIKQDPTRSNVAMLFLSFATLHGQLFFFFFCGVFFRGQCCLPCIRNGQSIIFVSSLGVWTFAKAAFVFLTVGFCCF